MNYPRISIVTPSFNQGQYIEQTILSIINQNYPNLEYIIIDGGSTDNTVEIIKKYKDRISYWVSEPDKGQSDAINKGIAKCTGDIFNWINSDDYLEPGALKEVAETFINAGADIVCGLTEIFNEEHPADISLHRTELFGSTEATLVQQRINQQAMFYRLSAVRKSGGVNNSLQYIMDLELWFRYLCREGQDKIALTDKLLAHFRIHATSKTAAHEQRFRIEEKATWQYMLTAMGIHEAWCSFFKTGQLYLPVKSWTFEAVDPGRLTAELAQRYLYPVFRSGNKKLSRRAYYSLLKSGRLSFNLQHIAMFVKIFIGDIPFRKFFKSHA
ncbi:MAG: glycosyltransferase [Ferruginibacter sp.]|nr:glycosyltransferase [Ferruginibacter sp.]